MAFFGYFSVAAIVIVLAVFYSKARRDSQNEDHFTDRMHFIVSAPKVYMVSGIVCASFFAAIVLFYSFTAADDDPAYFPVISVFTGFFILGAFLALYAFRRKLVVAGDWIDFTPLFGNKRRYFVRDMTHFKTDPTFGVRVYSDGKRLFSADTYSIGCSMLVSYLIEQGVRAPEKINLIKQ